MSALVFAGASQFVAVNLLATGAGLGEIILTTFLVNIRHLLMGAALAPRLRRQPVKVKSIIAFGVTDETFSVVSMYPAKNSNPGFVAGVNTIAYLGWVLGTACGSLMVKGLPALLQSSMGLALYAMFIGLLVPAVKKSLRLLLIALVAMFVNLLFSQFISPGWSIVLGTVIGGATGIYFLKDEDL